MRPREKSGSKGRREGWGGRRGKGVERERQRGEGIKEGWGGEERKRKRNEREKTEEKKLLQDVS